MATHGRLDARPALVALTVAVLSLVLPPSAGAAEIEPTPLTLEDAIARSGTHNAQLRAASASADASAAQADEARSALLPRADLSETLIRTDGPLQVFGARLSQEAVEQQHLQVSSLNEPDPLTDWATRLSVEAPIVHVSGWYAVRAAARGEDAARAAVRAAEAEVVAGTVRAYFGVKLADARLAVAEESLEAALADLERIEALRAEGMATDIDVLELQTHVAALEERRIAAEGAVDVARARLVRVLGAPRDARFALTTPLDSPAPAPLEEAGDPLPDHPDLERAEALAEAAEAQKTRAKMAFLPSLHLQAALESHREHFTDEFANGELLHWFVGLSLRINLFAGLGDRARLDAAKAGRERADAMRSDARDALDLAVEQARVAVAQADARLEVAREGVAAARERHRLERARLEAEMAETADLLRARADLLDAESRRLAALYSRHVAAVELAAALGTLDRGWKETRP
ncbi:MAG: TolC family protein [Myxococcota bacterium]